MRLRLVIGAAAAAVCGLAGAAAVLAPRTEPPVEASIVNSITGFGADHPEWAVRREERRDLATVGLNHALHMDHDSAKMQKRLAAAGAAALAVERLEDGLLALTCASCHEQDAAGRYMDPIRFDRHCAPCHTIDLPTLGGERVPHGDMPALVNHVDRHLLRELAKELNRAAASAPAGGAASFAFQPGAGWIEGARVESAATAQPRKTGPKATEPAAARLDMDAWLAERQATAYITLVAACGKCHTAESITMPPPEPRGQPFDVAPPNIPQRWLSRSVFSHRAHRALTCIQCHEQASTSRLTADIMLPSIASCRLCHAPAAGVRSDCVMCHIYHPPLTPSPPGSLTIEEYAGSGKR